MSGGREVRVAKLIHRMQHSTDHFQQIVYAHLCRHHHHFAPKLTLRAAIVTLPDDGGIGGGGIGGGGSDVVGRGPRVGRR